MRAQARSTSSSGFFIDGGNRRKTFCSSAANARSRGWDEDERSMAARQTLSNVLTVPRTMPGRVLMFSSSPRSVSGSASRTASRRLSGKRRAVARGVALALCGCGRFPYSTSTCTMARGRRTPAVPGLAYEPIPTCPSPCKGCSNLSPAQQKPATAERNLQPPPPQKKRSAR